MTPESVREMYAAVKADPDGNGECSPRATPHPVCWSPCGMDAWMGLACICSAAGFLPWPPPHGEEVARAYATSCLQSPWHALVPTARALRASCTVAVELALGWLSRGGLRVCSRGSWSPRAGGTAEAWALREMPGYMGRRSLCPSPSLPTPPKGASVPRAPLPPASSWPGPPPIRVLSMERLSISWSNQVHAQAGRAHFQSPGTLSHAGTREPPPRWPRALVARDLLGRPWAEELAVCSFPAVSAQGGEAWGPAPVPCSAPLAGPHFQAAASLHCCPQQGQAGSAPDVALCRGRREGEGQ